MRTYGEGCAVAHALDLVGERWALLVVRELLLGPKRFTDLRRGIPNASPNVLAQRLRELEQAGIVERRTLPPPAASQVYELTAWGSELDDVVMSLGRWGVRSPAPPRDAEVGVDSVILALRTLFDPNAAEEVEGSYELRLGAHRFRAQVRARRFEVVPGEAAQPDAIIDTNPGALVALFGGLPLAEALRSGDIEIDGDREMAERFLGLFSLPAPVATA